MSASRGKGLEADVAVWLDTAVIAADLRHWARMEPPMRGVGRGLFAPRGEAPPDYLAVTWDGTARYVECKEHAGPRWRLDAVEAHQARALYALPGSVVVVRWTEAGRTVAIPWAVLRPLWRDHSGRTERAASGTGSLTLDQAVGLGVEIVSPLGLGRLLATDRPHTHTQR